MKKLTALFISLFMVAGFLTSCGDGSAGTVSSEEPFVSQDLSFTPVNVSEYASAGQMYPLEMKLGDNADAVKAYYENAASSAEPSADDGHGHGEITLTENEFSSHIELNAVNELYCYLPDSNEVISAIVSYSDPYGFPLYVATEDDVIAHLGQPERSGQPEKNDVFFMLGPVLENYRILVYTYGTNRVTFIFNDGTMMAATIVNTESWKLDTQPEPAE
ncbi:MAG TPA: hypothetical protein H9675_04355 [Firmicutes bacterium]|nr:hypothetical protein [Bacillota bacterium]